MARTLAELWNTAEAIEIAARAATAEERSARERRRMIELYRSRHVYCPECGSDHVVQTTMMPLQWMPGPYRDLSNDAGCGECGWHGKVDDLNPLGNRSYGSFSY